MRIFTGVITMAMWVEILGILQKFVAIFGRRMMSIMLPLIFCVIVIFQVEVPTDSQLAIAAKFSAIAWLGVAAIIGVSIAVTWGGTIDKPSKFVDAKKPAKTNENGE